MTLQIAAVAEAGDLWVRRVINLALSLSSSPTGAQAEIASIVFVDDVDTGVAGLVKALGMNPVVAPRVRHRSPLNKIRMFELADPHLPMAALDCDILLAGDLSTGFVPDRLSAIPAQFPLLDDATWRRLYRSLGLPVLDQPILSSISSEPIPVPYLNSGVLLLPGAWCGDLAEAWTTYARLLDHHPILRPWTPVLEFHVEQIALACAVSALALPLTLLPLAYNLPFHERLADEVVALHYHRRMRADGTVETPPSVAGRAAVFRFNALLRWTGLAGPHEG